MMILAVDPGTESSAFVLYDSLTRAVVHHAWCPNDELLVNVLSPPGFDGHPVLVVEAIESYGMAVGKETFRTVWYAGRFHQAWPGDAFQLTRRGVKLHLCASAKAKDTNIRQALLDRFGGSSAIGKKAAPGPLHGLRAHEFAALAVAVTWADTHQT